MKFPALGVLVILIVGMIGFLVVNQFLKVEKAHSSFENYYSFRGCTQLLTKTDNDATCKTDSGQIIKIVKVNNKWYLDGDLPVCYFKFCI